MKLHFILVVCQIWLMKAQQSATFDPIDYISDFRALSKLPNFVDKTELLPLLITNATNHTFHIFTAPRKFGKSTIIDMIRRFVELPINSTSGEIINKTRTTNFKLFTDTKLDLKISRNKEFVQQHFGEYPVMLLNLTDVRGGSLPEQRRYLKAALQRMARKYAWLYVKFTKEPQVKTNDTDIVVRRLQYQGIGRLITGEISDGDMIDALQDLARAIFDHFGKEPFILIDSFDTPMQEASRHNIYETANVTEFMNNMLFMGLRYGPFISHHVVITGTSASFAKIAAHETRIHTPGFLEQSSFVPYFGLTSSEVDQLLGAQNAPEEERQKLDLYYNGYYCKDPSATSAGKIYNIFSVLKYLRERSQSGKPNYRNYWQQTGSMKNFNIYLSAPAIRGLLYNLILRKSLNLQFEETFTLKEFDQLKELQYNENPFQGDQGTLYFMYFIEHGYLARRNFKTEPNRYYIANLDAEFEIINIIHLFYKSHNLNLDPISDQFVKILEQATYPNDNLKELKNEVKRAVDRLPDANRLSFQTMLLCAARLKYPLTTTRLVSVDETTAYTNVTETKSVDVIVQNDERDVLHLICVKNKAILEAILKEAKAANPQDFVAVQGRQNRILGIYLGDHNDIDFEIVGSK